MLKKLEDFSQSPRKLRREFLEFHRLFVESRSFIPEIEDKQNTSEILKEIYDFNDGLIIGEKHFDGISAQFIIDNIAYLRNLGVDTLFFEGLYNKFENGPNNDRDIADSVHPEYQGLIEAAQYHGIKIIGLDSPGAKRGDGITRDIFMNLRANSIISSTNKNKWIALVGMMHLHNQSFVDPRSFMAFTVRGLSELTGAVSMIIRSSADSYIKCNSVVEAIAGKYINVDIELGLPMKVNSNTSRYYSLEQMSSMVNHLQDVDIKVKYYDIDPYAYGDFESGYGAAIILGLSFDSYESHQIEIIKYSLKSAVSSDDIMSKVKLFSVDGEWILAFPRESFESIKSYFSALLTMPKV
ncbi:hypothetical protein N9W34_01120 [Rickettsiales bacterium]|nr:hypothetical protein [Rickettsiales bacterium]